MKLSDLHSFFIYAFFGYALIFPGVLLFLRLLAIRCPGQRLQAYLVALTAPFVGFALFHTLLVKRCQAGILTTGPFWQLFDAFCRGGYAAIGYLGPVLVGLLAIDLLKAVAGAVFVLRLRQQTAELPTDERERVNRLLTKSCAAVGLGLPEVVYCRRDNFVALVAGVRRPVLVLSAPLLVFFSDAELEHILLHELSHIRHGDTFTGWLLRLVKDAVFFSPFSGLLLERCLLEKERLCDLEVVRQTGGEARAYAATLLKAWRLLLQRREMKLGLAAKLVGAQNGLEWRVKSLLENEAADRGKLCAPLFFALLVTFFAGTILFLGFIC